MNALREFKRRKEFLICVDSDGCAMDTMDIKHFLCFGPSMVEVWGLEKWEKEVLKRWNEINLYTMTRGVNRFKGLAMALEEINRKYCPIEGIGEFARWAEEAPELSGAAVKQAWKQAEEGVKYCGGEVCFARALAWSEKVNAGINGLDQDLKRPFDHAAETLAAAEENRVYYYPILVRQEGASWEELKERGLLRFRNGVYKEYGEEKKKEFFENLQG